jgi:hypothetical protein
MLRDIAPPSCQENFSNYCKNTANVEANSWLIIIKGCKSILYHDNAYISTIITNIINKIMIDFVTRIFSGYYLCVYYFLYLNYLVF